MARIFSRQAPALVIALAAACAVASTAAADPGVNAKRAQAQHVMAQLNQLDSNLERARTLYVASTRKLQVIEHNMKINTIALHDARLNLKRSQQTLMQRLVVIYTTRDDQSTLAVLLGATSLDDLVNRIESVQSVSSQDVAVLHQVVRFKREVTQHRHALAVAHRSQARLVQQRRAAEDRLSSQRAQAQRLLSSIQGQIKQLEAAARARALASAAAARARYDTAAQSQALALQQTAVGATASDGSDTVAPPSQYGGVVGIAMRYLGVPYVWGGESPSGFDCSGLVAYVYAQVGVSLPHYTGAQWNVGVPVARSDLQPGDLVFFDGLGHVGIYIGGNEFIHAPHTGTVVQISSLSGWYADTYVGARRIIG
ncbi:MAG TPA: NlpC/P60 family protein [Gaiellaceae bacterium]|nr:NlpC/P60 family protein [Gaiellaceae bacterium]